MNNVLAHAAATPHTESTKEIPLTKGKVAIVDAADYDWLADLTWNAVRTNKTGPWYAVSRKTGILMHRVIMNAAKGQHVDHRNGDGLNNTRSNLRFATHQQNMWNRRGRRNSKSGIKGVGWSSFLNKWRAEIEVGGKRISLGSFVDKHEAGLAYQAAANKYYGEFAYHEAPHS